MKKTRRFMALLLALVGVLGLHLALARTATPVTRAAPAAVTVSLATIGDARIQGGSPNVNFPSGFLYLATLNGHRVFTQFDLLALPANATIDAAELQLNFTSVLTGPNDIEVGRALGAWDELTLTWNNQPGITWGGPVQTVSANGVYSWDVTTEVAQWHSGAQPNYGFALRGNGGPLVAADSKETGVPPTLVITYSTPPPEGARPDLGDAPDSSNHLGIANTAYLIGGVPGRFPTVWDVPAGQPAGPRHDNLTREGILGDHLSSEVEADTGPDEDGANNILAGGADNADNDRGDDGWRNRQIKFFDCRKQTLVMRVSKAPGATLNRMYLNVWFDGNRDGDWADLAACQPPGGGPAQASYEWIVQDYIVDMTAVPAGGFLDIPVVTERVLNSTPGLPHWMRFTLSEERAVQPPGGAFPDGRGPHPGGVLGSYRFGETEDVRQLPPPPGEDGTLILEKRVLGADTPVDYPGVVTYQIRLRHEGGSQPIDAEIRDELIHPQHVLPRRDGGGGYVYVEVTSPGGGASPLEAELDFVSDPVHRLIHRVSWQGSLSPNSEVVLTFDVHVHPSCGPFQQLKTIDNLAQARPRGGDEITAEVSFEAECPGYDAGDVSFEWDDPIANPIDLSEYSNLPAGGAFTNAHPVTVTLAVTTALETNLPGAPQVELPGVRRVVLGPGESAGVNTILPLGDLVSDELALGDELAVTARMHYCFVVDGPYTLAGGDAICPDAQLYPNLVGQGEPLQISIRPRDLGDAPDSTNHAGVAMSAYPGTPGAFPTVYDPATGLPQGPMHRRPRPFHLGPSVSREAEADIGPDADPLNNIVPAANDPDNDRFDDGANPSLWPLVNCQTSNIPVRVFISPQAVNWFLQQDKPAYLNVWLDSNRDGDWADGAVCGANQSALEHIVIDFPVDVVGLGAGLHVLNVPTGLVPWPGQWAQQPFWARVTLSEIESNKTLLFGGISYGDGRGYATPFHTGETEDYHAYPAGAPGAGPDLAVKLAGVARRVSAPDATGRNVMGTRDEIRVQIEYANLGTRQADGAVLTLSLPEALHGLAPDLVQAPGLPAGSVTPGAEEIVINLQSVQVPDQSTILLGWRLASRPVVYTMTLQADVTGDLEPANNQAATAITPAPSAPLVAARAGTADGWAGAGATCRSAMEVQGVGVPGESMTILVDGRPAGTATADDQGLFAVNLSRLAAGPHVVQARPGIVTRSAAAQMAPDAAGSRTLIHVDPSLPIDPLSLVLTDSHGRNIYPPTLGFSFGVAQEIASLEPGETYEVGVDGCAGAPNQTIKIITDGNVLASLRDVDGDGRFSGHFTYTPTLRTPDGVLASELRFVVAGAGAEQSFSLMAAAAAPGTVRDGATQQPVAGASVSAGAGQESFVSWPATVLGQPNPVVTGADGAYRFTVPAGAGRVDATAAGYQAYRSWETQAENGLLAPDIPLTPEEPGAPVQTVRITANGYEPAVLTVPVGGVVEWVNVDLVEHTATGPLGDSGALAPGQRYRARAAAGGSYAVTDAADPTAGGAILVSGYTVFLPAVMR